MCQRVRRARQVRDHPREYGENLIPLSLDTGSWGPSPRIRGKCAAVFLACQRCGDHPREYGENVVRCAGEIPCGGPSPRIRGKSRGRHAADLCSGTIPANTGKMKCWSAPIFSCRDHPREYGENWTNQRVCRRSRGPSPRIRGKWLMCLLCAMRGGTIPANTGKMPMIRRSARMVWDHPREYGENTMAELTIDIEEGPSPRIRGKYKAREVAEFGERTIPANTGKIAPPWSE